MTAGIAEAVGSKFEPDEDWEPMLVVEAPDGVSVCTLEMDLATPKDRDILAQVVVPDLVRSMKGTRFALVTTAWQLKMAADAKRGPARIQDHPDRTECVIIYAFDRDERKRATAEITRGEGPPKLGAWEQQPLENSARFAKMWKAFG
jgi:hypothetical protein